ncbi:MAG: histidine phosphotransferase [Sulfitobacter litoralis]|uniref:histidine phosphotransferase family protein n=1 Tax=Sulfitobacter litoralis TaxID=335975 RepID=UPI001B49B7E1|nr:histidine phosphotransferase family protein [Sulfitobacter litoralis]MBQ0767140.1 histidine phosphotransferase [Sulfitobacter litoralis]
MAETDTDFAALIGSRICHDLISPVGAINNGLELLLMSGMNMSPEVALIDESVRNASARLRFFRVAFGGGNTQPVAAQETADILSDLYAQSKWEVIWPLGAAPSRSALRMVFLGLLCLETGMPYGGRIEIEHRTTGWDITGTADRLNINAALWGVLAGQPLAERLLPAQVQFGLLPAIVKDSGQQLTSIVTETTITLSIKG